MKKLLSILILFICFATLANAQETPYQQVMKKEISQLMSADSLPQYQKSANAFARIGQLNQKEWLPLYYQALAYTNQGFSKLLSLDKRDEAFAKATELVDKASGIQPDQSELVTLKGFILMGMVSADPAGRGASLSGTVLQTYGKALGIDPKNPRALILMAQMEYGMSKFFKTGPEKACGLANQSQALFEAQDDKALNDQLMPTWGKSMADDMVKACK